MVEEKLFMCFFFFFFTSWTSSLLLCYNWFGGKFVSRIIFLVCFYYKVESINVEKETSNIYVGGME